MERAALICEKMAFKGCFSLTKTATGILFKFSHPDDYQAVFKKGFHKVTGARFYRKVSPPTHTHISSDWKGIMGHKVCATAVRSKVQRLLNKVGLSREYHKCD